MSRPVLWRTPFVKPGVAAKAVRLPVVSVIVPVYRNAAGLQLCLRALGNQTYPRERHEVIVVDNGAELTAGQVGAWLPGSRLLHEPAPGSYAARNAGLPVALGEVLAFTDSDCIPHRDWLLAGAGALPKTGLAAVGGRVEIFFRSKERPRAVDLLTRLVSYNQAGYIQQHGFAITANLFARRSTFEVIGPFDSTLLSAGDSEWSRRLTAAGGRLVYAADATVAHPTPPTVRAFLNRVRRQVGGQEALKRRRPARAGLFWSDLADDLARNADYLRRILREPLCARLGARLGVLALVLVTQQVVLLERLRLRAGRAALR